MTGKEAMKLQNRHYYITQAVLCALLAILLLFSFWLLDSVHPKATYSERIEMRVRKQTINDIDQDRIQRHKSRLMMNGPAQKLANKRARKSMKALDHLSRKPIEAKNNLHSNGKSRHHNPVARKLEHSGSAYYGQNIAEISLGKRHFSNTGHRYMPYHKIMSSYDMANITNQHFMKYDQAKKNVHRNNILNNRSYAMGVSVMYNPTTNHGVIVEEFVKRHPKKIYVYNGKTQHYQRYIQKQRPKKHYLF